MNCQAARDIFPELLDRRTPAGAQPAARAHLASCPDCQREFSALSQTLAALDAMPDPAPTPRLRQNFYAMLEEEKNSAASVRTVAARQHRARRLSLFTWILSPVAGCALVAIGFFAGTRSAGPDETTRRELASMRDQIGKQADQLGKMAKMTQLVGRRILQQQEGPANERLREVLASASTEKPDDKVLDDLILALAWDPSANVRLRALEALYPHADRQLVRSGVLGALPREENPLVQLEMIDFVAAARDRAAGPVLEKMAQNESVDVSVRDAARRALAQL
ncbi:MAG: hypothetical protein NTV51_09270 [Verrucomicrobia bacterium]|nr:hypothetical protein [Verrucomicrobiota bacterium]